MRGRWLIDLREKMAGIAEITEGGETKAGQKVEGKSGVLKKGCTDEVSMDLE